MGRMNIYVLNKLENRYLFSCHSISDDDFVSYSHRIQLETSPSSYSPITSW